MVWESAVALGMTGSGFIFVYLAMVLERNHLPLTLLYLFSGLWTLIAMVNNLGLITQSASQSNIANVIFSIYGLYIWVLVFTVAYFLILFMYNMFKNRRLNKGIN